jgi:hypothetical protein
VDIMLKGTALLDAAAYGADVTRKDGSPVEFIEVFDREQPNQRAVRVTLGPDAPKVADLPPIGSLVDLEGVLQYSRDGKAKLRADRVRLSQAVSNGTTPKEPIKAAA